MKTQVTFETEFFKPLPGEETETNPGRYGKALALWLADQLKSRGVPVQGVIAEDWGWVVTLSRKPFLLWVGCGNNDDSTTEWRVFSEAEPALLWRLFKRGGAAPALKDLHHHLTGVVPSIPGVTNVVWE